MEQEKPPYAGIARLFVEALFERTNGGREWVPAIWVKATPTMNSQDMGAAIVAGRRMGYLETRNAHGVDVLEEVRLTEKGVAAGSKWLTEYSLADRHESERQGFKSNRKIEITGRRIGRANEVFVDDQLARIPDTSFPIFLRLVLGLFASDDGWVDLTDEMNVDADDMHKAVHRLRVALAGVVGGQEEAKMLIESGHDGTMRISTHHGRIHYDKKSLLGLAPAIQKLAKRLP